MSEFSELIGAEQYQSIIKKADIAISGVRVRAVLPPLPKPLKTASGKLTHAPVLLVDIETSA